MDASIPIAININDLVGSNIPKYLPRSAIGIYIANVITIPKDITTIDKREFAILCGITITIPTYIATLIKHSKIINSFIKAYLPTIFRFHYTTHKGTCQGSDINSRNSRISKWLIHLAKNKSRTIQVSKKN